MKISISIYFLAMLFPTQSLAETSQFLGLWCTNPCFFGSSRSFNLPCNFEITATKIQWERPQETDRSITKSFSLDYELIEKEDGTETFIVTGGGVNWYDPSTTIPNNKHKLVFTRNHGNTARTAKNNVKLTRQMFCTDTGKWCGGGSFFIRPLGEHCP